MLTDRSETSLELSFLYNSSPDEESPRRPLIATYRIQLHPGFTFDDAIRILDYLKELGVSHVYCSPYLQAVHGSPHGYDVVDPRKVNQELGGEEAHARFVQTLKERGLGQVLDIVPNHMAVSGPDNPWWWDVLENGPSSRYASYFDVDWDPPEVRHSNEVLVPVLGDHYGRVLEAGEIELVYQPENRSSEREGSFYIRYYENIYPVDPRSLSGLLDEAARRSGSEILGFISTGLAGLPHAPAADRPLARRRYRDAQVLYRLLNRHLEERPDLEQVVCEVTGEISRDPDKLDLLLGLQNYRLAYWRMAQRELGYRRFFDINSLMGLRMEDPQVFEDTHGRILEWLKAGVLDGVRVDHPDGLRDPEEYLRRMSESAPGVWIVVEKILEEGESLPGRWPVAGTTGYDFLNRVNGLFVDGQAEHPLSEFYNEITGHEVDFQEMVREKKLQVLEDVLGSDVNRLTMMLVDICERHRRYRDYTRNDLRAGLCELAACLPVYRTYVYPAEGRITTHDREHIAAAVAASRENRPDLEPELFEFLERLLLFELNGALETEFVLRFQQFTGPAMAKGVEDTAFYNFNRFVTLNEVGGNPALFGISPEDFHTGNQEAQEQWPLTMLTTSTHDTKRSEDVRARLNVLSEIPQAWQERVRGWMEMNAALKQDGMPDSNDEYLLYQVLVGTWPISEDRLLQYMEKAIREAKTHTSWTDTNEDYENAVAAFVRGVLASQAFTQSLDEFVNEIKEAGRINSLAQSVIKLTVPGVPDIYQGTELWDLSLVDPDNRRPVDYDLRRKLVDRLSGKPTPDTVLEEMDSGLPKMWVIRKTLELRRRRLECFGASAGYQQLEVQGDHAVAFGRSAPGGEIETVTIVPLLSFKRDRAWRETQVQVPEGEWRSVFDGRNIRGGWKQLADLLELFPVCLLERVEETDESV
jgi:(1->4)-alpha-D-glucan 1-alpha-D-glucosylmutase